MIRATQAKNEQLVNNGKIDWLISESLLLEKKFPEKENPNKIVNIVEKILDFDK